MPTTLFRKVLIILFIGYSLPALKAQEYRYEIGGMAGGAFYMGDTNKSSLFQGLNPSFGGVFRYNANFRWAIKADLLWARVSGGTVGIDNVFPDNLQVSFDRNLVELGGQAEFNFFPYSDKYAYLNTKRFTPYMLLGLGMTIASGGENTFSTVHIPLGVGVKYKIKERINLGCEFSVRKLFGDGLEGLESLDDPYGISGSPLKNKDWYSCLLLSVTWDFGLRKNPCNSKLSNSAF